MLFSFSTLSYPPGSAAAGHSVTRITLDPPTPNVLLHGQKVTVRFSYATTQAGGVLIWARPISAGSPSPAYAASGANVSPTGSGTGTQDFTITAGNVTVDQVRIQMYNADQTKLLLEVFLPVHYQFRAP
jgi:hypothetical protein